MQLVRGLGPLQAGLVELPTTIASIAVIALVSFLLSRLGAGRAIALGLVVAALGLGLVGFALSWDGYVGIVTGMAVIGLGIGIASTLANDAVVTQHRKNAPVQRPPSPRPPMSSGSHSESRSSGRCTRSCTDGT